MSEQNQNPYQQTPQPNPYQQTPPTNLYNTGAEEKTNTLSIVGLVLAFLVNIAGLIVSIIALKQIKETGEKGRGLAIAGIIVSIISMILGIVFAVLLAAGVGLWGSTSSVSSTPLSSSSSSTFAVSASPSATSTPSASASASPTPSPSASSTKSMGEAWPSAGDVSSPDTPYCQAMSDFVLKVTAPDDESSPSGDEVLAALINLRDNTTDEYTKEKLSLAIEAVYNGDEQAFEDELTAALLTITFDAEKCGVEF